MKLRGVPDIVVRGEQDTIIDLKTGHINDAALQEASKFQLLAYAHLFEASFGELPHRLVIFSLVRGTVTVTFNANAVNAILRRIAEARSQHLGEARPDPKLCNFCHRRLVCEPHWQALKEWDRPDAVRGIVLRVEHASSGGVGVMLETDGGEVWVTHLSATVGTDAEVGAHLRAVRVAPRDPDRPAAQARMWRAGDVTGVHVGRPHE